MHLKMFEQKKRWRGSNWDAFVKRECSVCTVHVCVCGVSYLCGRFTAAMENESMKVGDYKWYVFIYWSEWTQTTHQFLCESILSIWAHDVVPVAWDIYLSLSACHAHIVTQNVVVRQNRTSSFAIRLFLSHRSCQCNRMPEHVSHFGFSANDIVIFFLPVQFNNRIDWSMLLTKVTYEKNTRKIPEMCAECLLQIRC